MENGERKSKLKKRQTGMASNGVFGDMNFKTEGENQTSIPENLRSSHSINLNNNTNNNNGADSFNEIQPKPINYDEEKRLSRRKEQKIEKEHEKELETQTDNKEPKKDELHNSDDVYKSEEEEEEESDEGKSQKFRVSTREIQSYHLLAFILTIRASVSLHLKLGPLVDVQLDDFKQANTFFIMPIGAPDQILVKEYAGKIFQEFRRKSVTPEHYLWSWSHSSLKDPSRTLGKSDASFIYSYDNRYLIKTLSQLESKWLLKILPSYYEYLKENEHSLLTRFLGLYRLTEGNKSVYFTVIPNIFESRKMKEVYDLKGSTRVRKSGDPNAPLLDKDIKRKFIFGPNRKEEFMSQLKRDSKFLADNNLMDYSLLIGVCDVNEKNNFPRAPSATKSPGMVCFLEGDKKKEIEIQVHEPPSQNLQSQLKPSIKRSHRIDISNPNLNSLDSPSLKSESFVLSNEQNEEIYYAGIIDYLQKYNSKKKIISFAKALAKDKDEISTVAPGFYSRRFVEFIDSLIE